MKKVERSVVGEQIRTIRRNMDLTQEELANKIGVSKNYVAKIESRNVVPSVNVLRKISEESGWRIEDIVEGRYNVTTATDGSTKESNLQEFKALAEVYSPELVAKALLMAQLYLSIQSNKEY